MAGDDLNRSVPVLSYTSQDAESLIPELIQYAQTNYAEVWTDYNDGQMGRALLDLVAYVFDMSTFQENALINETFVTTALRRNNVIDRGRTLNYKQPSAVGSTVVLTLEVNPSGPFPATLSTTSTRMSNSGRDRVIFMPVSDVVIASYPVGGTIDVTFQAGEYVNLEVLGSSDGSASQRFRLAQKPLIDGSLTVLVNGVAWEEEDFIVELLSSDQKYTTRTDDDDNTYIIFGDGDFGVIPPSGQAITATYRIGGGRSTNIGQNTITSIVNAPPAIVSVTNAGPATNGANAPSLSQVREAIPAGLTQYTGILNEEDSAAAARVVPGVAKATAFQRDPLTRQIGVVIAPDGGGVPTSTLKNQVRVALAQNKVLGIQYAMLDPVYKDLRLDVLLYAAPGVRQGDLAAKARALLIDADGGGYLDFDQVDFGGVDSDGVPFASDDALQAQFDQLIDSGLRRARIVSLDVDPVFRRLAPTLGNGTITGVTLPTNDHARREWVIQMTSATTFNVKERIVGTVTSIQNTVLQDDAATYPTDLAADGYTVLNPDRRLSPTVTVSSNTSTSVTIASGDLFALTAVGAEYYIERSLAATGTVGVQYDALSPSGQIVVQFTVNAGSDPWFNGDEVILDVFPPLGDITLRFDEIPQMLDANLSIRVSGGVAS